MNLYLMRHADAGVARENPKLDAKRGLVKEGKEQCMLMARLLGAIKVQVDVIVSSPLKRAL
ncbi:MAG: histidine phosphatase family protein, partial [Terracidiphilus sp.]